MELLTTAQVAARTNIKETTLRWWRHAGKGPQSFRLEGSVRYDSGDLEQWLEAQRTSTASGGG